MLKCFENDHNSESEPNEEKSEDSLEINPEIVEKIGRRFQLFIPGENNLFCTGFLFIDDNISLITIDPRNSTYLEALETIDLKEIFGQKDENEKVMGEYKIYKNQDKYFRVKSMKKPDIYNSRDFRMQYCQQIDHLDQNARDMYIGNLRNLPEKYHPRNLPPFSFQIQTDLSKDDKIHEEKIGKSVRINIIKEIDKINAKFVSAPILKRNKSMVNHQNMSENNEKKCVKFNFGSTIEKVKFLNSIPNPKDSSKNLVTVNKDGKECEIEVDADSHGLLFNNEKYIKLLNEEIIRKYNSTAKIMDKPPFVEFSRGKKSKSLQTLLQILVRKK